LAPPPGVIIVNNDTYPTQSDLPSACSTPTYPTIDDAVGAASSGDTIYVCAGTYDENISIDLPLILDGAEYGVDAVGRSGYPETIIDSADGITYAPGATTGTVSGFDLNGLTDTGPGEITADPGLSGVGSGWTFTDNIVDVSEGGIGLNTDGISNPSLTTISDNEFTQSTPSNAGSGWDGQAVTIWGESGNNVTISHNDFSGLSGPGSAINTTGDGLNGGCQNDPSTNLSITDNTFESTPVTKGYEENLVALFCTSGASITDNTATITGTDDPNAESPIFLGGGDISPVISGNTETGNGASDAAGVEVNTGFYPTDNPTVENNHITGFNWGVFVYGGSGYFSVGLGSPDLYAAPSDFTIGHNTISGSANGIDIWNDESTYDGSPNYPSGTITDNTVSGSSTYDCVDQTTGGGTVGTDDTWTGNTGSTSSPLGLCTPPPPVPPGDWVGVYGLSGYALGGWNGSCVGCMLSPDDNSNDLSSLPSGVTYAITGPILRWQWANPTTDTRALESPDKSTREATCWYSNTTFTLTLSFTNAFSGNLELYAVDWDSKSRNETMTITVTDGSGSASTTLSSFVNGAWTTFPISASSGGQVAITVTHNGGDNAVLSGLFLN
jgi:hypothetical protein